MSLHNLNLNIQPNLRPNLRLDRTLALNVMIDGVSIIYGHGVTISVRDIIFSSDIYMENGITIFQGIDRAKELRLVENPCAFLKLGWRS